MDTFNDYRKDKWELLKNFDTEPPCFPFKIDVAIDTVEDIYNKNQFRMIRSFEMLKKEKPIVIPNNGSFGVRRQLSFPITKQDVKDFKRKN